MLIELFKGRFVKIAMKLKLTRIYRVLADNDTTAGDVAGDFKNKSTVSEIVPKC